MKHFFVVISFLFIFACQGSHEKKQPSFPPPPSQPTASLATKQGNFVLQLEIANTPEKREQGLMHRTDLGDDKAMLFIWDENVLSSFWMKDTPTALDIIFLNDKKVVTYIAPDNKPLSEDLITPLKPFRYALEVKAGFALKTGLKVGDIIEFSLP